MLQGNPPILTFSYKLMGVTSNVAMIAPSETVGICGKVLYIAYSFVYMKVNVYHLEIKLACSFSVLSCEFLDFQLRSVGYITSYTFIFQNCQHRQFL